MGLSSNGNAAAAPPVGSGVLGWLRSIYLAVVAGGAPTGTFNYVSATRAGAGNVTGVGRCIGIRVFAAGVDGTFNINGGNTITVRNGTGVDVNPQGQVTAPVVNWVSGTIDILIVGLT